VKETLVIHTDSLKTPRLEVPVRGQVLGPYVLKPTRLTLGVISSGRSVDGMITVLRKDKEPFTVAGTELLGARAESTPGDGARAVRDRLLARSWVIRVALDSAPMSRGLWQETLRLELTDESGDSHEVCVPVVGFCMSSDSASAER
jgi:hypothetical protein